MNFEPNPMSPHLSARMQRTILELLQVLTEADLVPGVGSSQPGQPVFNPKSDPELDSLNPNGLARNLSESALLNGGSDLVSQIEWSEETWGEESSANLGSGLGDRLDLSWVERNYLLELGELPAVQDRFYTLIKRRLAGEIEQNLPLFPWESEVLDYGSEPVKAPVTVPVGLVAPLWWRQRLQLPVQLPEVVFNQLLQRCQDLVQSSLLEGAKLVQAVESLFPEQDLELNRLAGFVMAAPARSAAVADEVMDQPPAYETAGLTQQMALSLLAARELLNTLTLTLSAAEPVISREWVTEMGVLAVTARLNELSGSDQPEVVVQATLPCGGEVHMAAANGLAASARREDAGTVTVQQAACQALTVTLDAAAGEASALTFAVRIV